MMARIENHSSDSEDWTDIGLRVGAAAERGEGVAKNIEEAAWWYANAFMSSTSRQSVILSRGIGDRLASLIEAGTVARTPKFVWPPALEDTRTSTDPASSADSAEEISSAPGAPGAPAGSPLSRIGVDPGRGDSDGSGTESDGSKSAGSAAILKRLSLD
jgi:TPR repeat protein